MNLTVLVACMNQKDHSLLKKMNISTNAIIVNQCNENKIEEFKYNNNDIKYISLNERGVGLSRNTSMMRAKSDIIVFADEDEIFENDYENIILNEFKKNKKADLIIFNVESINDNRPQYNIKKIGRVRLYNCLKYGAVRVAAKTKSIHEKNISFSLLFGGGAKYSNGEDSLFISDCIKSGLKVYCSNALIGKVKQNSSTWFKGYTKKYFVDRGILYRKIFGVLFVPVSIRFLFKIRNSFENEITFKTALKYMLFCKKYEVEL